MSTRPTHTSCQFIECSEPLAHMSYDYCEYHSKGGMIGNGESYEQYQIIEQDFIDFIKVVPLEEAHFNVHSPLLRDIIIRTCVQIEIFFKEWAKMHISEDNSTHANALLAKYNRDDKKERNWNIGDYFGFQDKLNETYTSLHVMPLNMDIKPFDTWKSEKHPPDWWNVYNGIKHGSIQNKKAANLGIALYTLAGLFLMHCANWRSSRYLTQFNIPKFDVNSSKVDLIENRDITTPLDSKKYLFKYGEARPYLRRVKLVTQDDLKETVTYLRRQGKF